MSTPNTRRRSTGPSAAYRIITLVCGLIIALLGIYLVIAVFNTNGFKSHWRIVLVTQFVQSMFDALQSEQINMQEP